MRAFRLIAFAILLMLGSGVHAQPYVGMLSGAAEQPPVSSPGTGTARVTVSSALNTLTVDVAFSGLLAGTTAAHIHCCVAPPGNVGVATQTPSFAGFPLGVTAGTYVQVFDLTASSSFNPAFINANGGTVAGAAAALRAGLANGQAYFNIHTSMFPGGEIRSFLVLSDAVFRDGFETPGTALSLLRCDRPADGSLVDLVPGAGVSIAGTALGLSDVKVNGTPVAVAADRTFSAMVIGRYGVNLVELSGTDGAGATRTGLCAFLGAERWLTEGAQFDEALLFSMGLLNFVTAYNTWFSRPSLQQSLDSSLLAGNPLYTGGCGNLESCVTEIRYLSLAVTPVSVSSSIVSNSTLNVRVQLNLRMGLQVRRQIFGLNRGSTDGELRLDGSIIDAAINLGIDLATRLPKVTGVSVDFIPGAVSTQFPGLEAEFHGTVASEGIAALSPRLAVDVGRGAAGLFEGLFAGYEITPAGGFQVGRLDGSGNVTTALGPNTRVVMLQNGRLRLDTALRITAPSPSISPGRFPISAVTYPVAARVADVWSAAHVGVYNQVLQALWRVGLFDGTVDGPALGPGLPAGTSLSAQLRIMPVVTAFDPSGTAGLDVGALDLVVTHPDLPPGLRVTAGARIRAQAALLADDLVFGNIVVDELHISTGGVSLDTGSRATLQDLVVRLLVKLAGVALNDSLPVLPATVFTFPPSLGPYGFPVGGQLVANPRLVTEANYVFLEGSINVLP